MMKQKVIIILTVLITLLPSTCNAAGLYIHSTVFSGFVLFLLVKSQNHTKKGQHLASKEEKRTQQTN
jgi:hypothetical protein